MPVGRIHCKICDKWFANETEWKENTSCDKLENCPCPEVRGSMKQAQTTIQKAKEQAGYRVIRKEEYIATNRDETIDQVYVAVSPLLQIEVSSIKRPNRGKKS